MKQIKRALTISEYMRGLTPLSQISYSLYSWKVEIKPLNSNKTINPSLEEHIRRYLVIKVSANGP